MTYNVFGNFGVTLNLTQVHNFNCNQKVTSLDDKLFWANNALSLFKTAEWQWMNE